MKTLSLVIKQQWFDKIMSGEKTTETREIKPNTQEKYIKVDPDGYALEDENGNCVPREYDAIRLYVGYNKGRDTALVKIRSAKVYYIVDENDEPITYETGETDENGDPVLYVAAQIEYELGDILESRWSNGKK